METCGVCIYIPKSIYEAELMVIISIMWFCHPRYSLFKSPWCSRGWIIYFGLDDIIACENESLSYLNMIFYLSFFFLQKEGI